MELQVSVVLVPGHLEPAHLDSRAVVVFDVLRATTSMTAALAAGVEEIRVFPDLEYARRAAQHHTAGPRILCGEENCLPPPGFDLGNSPGAFNRQAHRGAVAYMSTTNGTRAIIAAAGAAVVFVGALVNAQAVASALLDTGLDATLLCAGTNGQVAMEDLLGAGAVLDAMARAESSRVRPSGDVAHVAQRLYRSARSDLRAALAESQGGRNVIAAGLPQDIDYAARLDSLDVVGFVAPEAPVVRRWTPSRSRPLT
jgi:2-phosphosulfolactate phosphatase